MCNYHSFAIIPFFFVPPSAVGRTGNSYLQISSIAALTACNQDWTYESNMPCAFRPCPSGTNIDRGFNREHVESCSPTTKNIVTLLPQYLWPPNWAGSNYLEQLPPIKLLYSLVTWSWKITWQIKTIISPLLQCLWQSNLAGCWFTLNNSHP